jgi:signal peptidase I
MMNYLAMAPAAALAALVTASAVRWLRNRYTVVTVVGRSMLPTYAPGDRLLVARRAKQDPLTPGQVVVADVVILDTNGVWVVSSRYPMAGAWVIKRIAAVAGDPIPSGPDTEAASGAVPAVPHGEVFMLGDNLKESSDSRLYGCMSIDLIHGVVRRRIA